MGQPNILIPLYHVFFFSSVFRLSRFEIFLLPIVQQCPVPQSKKNGNASYKKESNSKNATLIQAQIECFLNPDWQRKHWKDEDIQKALIIWTTSKKTYRYLRNAKILPLPCERFLQDKIKHIQLPPGILVALEDIMETKAALLTPKQRVVQLSFDEV